MARDTQTSTVTDGVQLIGQKALGATYDEAFLSCTEGYCVFDADQKLVAYSSNFPGLYPRIEKHVTLGMDYRSYMTLFASKAAIQNLGTIEDIDSWVDNVTKQPREGSTRFVHHLSDGRWMQIFMSPNSGGGWFFVAFDITAQHESRSALELSHDRFVTFAHLAMDWFWELDKDLRYTYHSGHQKSPHRLSEKQLEGRGRIEVMKNVAVPNEYLKRHNQLLLDHQPVDVVLKWLRPDDSPLYSHVLAEPRFDKHGEFSGYIGCGRDVTSETLNRIRLNHLAEHDDLTGLLNRRAFEVALADALRSAEQGGVAKSLCFLDLDQFKLVNDGGGHEAGDQLLMNIANRFSEHLGDNALVARLGGDEFGVIVNADVQEALRRINRLIHKISSTPFKWNQRKYTVGASSGLVAIDEGSRDVSELMSRADTACYIAKNAGRNQVQLYIYDEYFQDPISLELRQVNLLREAMDNDGLILYLQPIKAIQEERSDVHFEVLLRLRGTDGKIKSAGEFIPVAEKYDLMQHLDRWVVRESLAVLNRMLGSCIDVSLSINLSGNSLNNAECFALYEEMIIDSGLSPTLLTFEVTETSAIKNLGVATEFINKLKALGCQFSLDDFGSGLSSFSYLKELPVDYLKIDGGFVKEMKNDPTCRAIVSAFNQLSHELGMKTVAEFVEDEDTENLLRELGVDYVQGYGVGAPQHVDKWISLLDGHAQRTGTDG